MLTRTIPFVLALLLSMSMSTPTFAAKAADHGDGAKADHKEEAHGPDVAGAAGILTEEAGIHPSIMVQAGDPIPLIRKVIVDNPNIAALVLGAAATGAPGPLVTHFAGVEAGQLPCPVMVVPGGLDTDALDRLS